MSNELFWRYYLIFMAGILLIPIFRNIYCLCRYKMTSSKYDKHIIEAFCKDATHICVARPRTIFYMSIILFIPACIYMTHYMLFFESRENDMLSYIVNLTLHILVIIIYVELICGKYIITNTAILIRHSKTKYTFYVLNLHDILQYDEFSYFNFPYWFIDGDKSLVITTKDMKKFILYDMNNHNEFVSILKIFTENSKTGDTL